MRTKKFVLYWRIPSKKNSKVIVMRWRYPILLSSQAYLNWESEQIDIVKDLKLHLTRETWPFQITANFYFPDLRETDLSNKFESVADMLVKAWKADDDNSKIFKRVILDHIDLDRENPRVEITISDY